IIFNQLGKAGLSVADVKAKRKRAHEPLLPAALVEYCGEAYERIAVKAMQDDPRAFGPFVSMMDHIHRVMQPAKDENGNGGQTPRRAVFVGEGEPVPPVGAPPAAEESKPGTLVDKDGQVFEDPGA